MRKEKGETKVKLKVKPRTLKPRTLKPPNLKPP